MMYCDACTKIIDGTHYTDDEVCQGSDAPGFFLCDRESCMEARDLPLEERRVLYAKGRAAKRASNLKHYVVDVLARTVQRTTVYLDAVSQEEAEDRALALVRSDVAAWEWAESAYHNIKEDDVFEASAAEHDDPAEPLPCPKCSGSAYRCGTGDCFHCACGEVVEAPSS